MSKRELLYYLLENNTNISIGEIAIGILMSVILACFIFFIYKKTYSGVVYSANFNATLVLITVITTMVMMIIGSNLALSLGMVGALSIVRFRTAVKDAKDGAYIFWAIAVGISCGTGIYVVGIIGSIVIALILLFMKKGVFEDTTYLVIVHGREDLDCDAVSRIVDNNCKGAKLKMRNTSSLGVDITYEVSLEKGKDNALTKELKAMETVASVNVVSYNGEIAG